MNPIKTEECNAVFTLPGGTEENDLHCIRKDNSIISFWIPGVDDRELLRDGSIKVTLHVQTHWRSAVQTAIALRENNGTQEPWVQSEPHRWDDGYQCVFVLNPKGRDTLLHGGQVVLKVGADPTPAVTLWLDRQDS